MEITVNNKKKFRLHIGDRAFNIFNVTVMIVTAVIALYPFYYCLVLSFNEGRDAQLGGIWLFPRKFTLENYIYVFKDIAVIKAFFVTVARTIIGTAATVLFNALYAYGLVKKNLMLRKTYISMGLFTMYFSGGIIPAYILMLNLKLLDNFLVYIIPSLSSFFNVLIFMAFFRDVSSSLIESAKIDGANEYLTFFRIVLPVSLPVIATMALFSGVHHWNAWYDGYIYMNDNNLETLPTYLVKVINRAQAEEAMLESGEALSVMGGAALTTDSVKLATMVVAVLPITLVYPFLQKYFVGGIMIGSVKE